MKKTVYIVILLLTSAFAGAQTSYINNLKFENLRTTKENNRVLVKMDLLLNELEVNSNDMVTVTPLLSSNKSDERLELSPVVIVGKRRNKVLDRKISLNNAHGLPPNTQRVVLRHNGSQQVINYNDAVPYAEWMDDASLRVTADVKGCADCGENLGELLLGDRILPEPYSPTYKLIYVVPEVEQVKARADRHTATFNYVVAKHDLVRSYKNNASEFNRVDRVINEVINNKDIEITEFTVSGYASPEGSFDANRDLSDRRAHSFADYLSNTHGISRNRFVVHGYGEDWEGLKEAVESSSLPDKSEIVRIIANVDNPDARDGEMKKLSRGQTYRTLVESYYPPLRRTDYTIAYNVRAFSVEEAREVIRSNPNLLSLNEMYLVAHSYPATSKEFKEVFDIATRLYPDEPIAIINSAAADIEGGNHQAAIGRLSKMENDPRALNNMGVAYVRMGDNEKAKEYFGKAAALNEADARSNLTELQKSIEHEQVERKSQ